MPQSNVPYQAPGATSAAAPSGRCGIAQSKHTLRPSWSYLPGKAMRHRPRMSSRHFAAISNAEFWRTALSEPTVMSA